MLLLNAIRTLVILLAVLLGYTFHRAYNLTDMGLMMVGAAILFVALCVDEAARSALIAYFNPEEKKP